MKYKYLAAAGATDIHGHFIKRPIVEIEVSHGSLRRPFLALLDSGADDIILPAAIAEAFGIDRVTCRPHTTVGISMQPITGFIAPITIHIKHQPQSFDAEAVFIDTEVPILLGRDAFFDAYRIKFEQDHHTFEISEAPLR
jgi:hypothetical protein